MRSRSRDVRSTRREVQAMKRGGVGVMVGSFEHTDDCPCPDCAEDSPFPLKDGTQADPRQAWVLPSNEQEK